MTTENKYAPSIYRKSVNIDPDTGLPADYNSFQAAYFGSTVVTAHKQGIPLDECQDAAQEVQLKFWMKNGLEMYDPSKGTKFATLYRRWSSMFMLQERDKSIKNQRVISVDPIAMIRDDANEGPSTGTSRIVAQQYGAAEAVEFEEEIIQQDYLSRWLREAEQKLVETDNAHLVPVLKLCVLNADDNKKPSRAEIAQVAGVKITKATDLLKELRNTLTELGFGMETLYV